MVVEGRTGALDPPGIPWRDRPQPNRSAGIFVVGDMMAAPGMLSEVALSSALEASAAALTWNVGQSDSPRRSPTSELGSQ
jgi:hypothetical protein